MITVPGVPLSSFVRKVAPKVTSEFESIIRLLVPFPLPIIRNEPIPDMFCGEEPFISKIKL